MLSRLLKSAIQKPLYALGLELCRSSRRSSLGGVLNQARQAGLPVKTVIDVGAAFGDFALECHRVFPDARYILVEPLKEYESLLTALVKTLPNSEYVAAAAGSKDGEVTINVHPDLVGSSFYLEDEDSSVNGVPRTVRSVALDSLKTDLGIEGPCLLKMDIQGAELDALSRSESLLSDTPYLLLEVSLFEFFKGGPQLFDVIAFMKAKDFVVYDMFGLQYRPLDGALSQVDIAFVKDNGPLRRHHSYATPGQREEQNRHFQSVIQERLKRPTSK